MSELLSVGSLVSLLTLTSLEIVLGIDNIVFVAICVVKLSTTQQPPARRIGLVLAMIARILLLLAIGWLMGLDQTLFDAWGFAPTGRDLILLAGGLFLIGKATYEIHDKLEGAAEELRPGKAAASFGAVLVQIVIINIVFSLDSVITAVGMTSQMPYRVALPIMIVAIVVSSLVMLAFAGAIAAFIERHPTMKVLGLSFLLLIGVMLVAEGFHKEIPKGYVYFSMAFSLLVESLNIRMRKKSAPLHLRQTYVAEPAPREEATRQMDAVA